jgi:hypothetical protein
MFFQIPTPVAKAVLWVRTDWCWNCPQTLLLFLPLQHYVTEKQMTTSFRQPHSVWLRDSYNGGTKLPQL